MKYYIIAPSLLITLLLSGCIAQPPAPIEYGNDNSTNTSDSSTIDDSGTVTIKPLPKREKYEDTSGILKEPDNAGLQETLQIAEPDNTKMIYHEVQEDETLEKIARDYNVSQEEIAKLNNLEPPYKLEELQVIKIKVSPQVLNKKNKATEAEILKPNLINKEAAVNMPKFIKPTEGKIITRFGEHTRNAKSNGISIEAPLESPIKSIGDGIVVHVGHDTKFGNLVIVKLDESDIYAAYAHMDDMILIKGQHIKQGELIGHVGSTGDVTKPQLHFAIREGKVAVDPLKYIPE
jgi:murein DD-endopeptidase MepM/ murein hydrolase activator NlpD